MMCLLVQEFEAVQAGVNMATQRVYMHYGPSSGTLHNGVYHPNRCVYIIPETDPLYSWYSIKQIGHHHYFDDAVAHKQGWI